MQKDNHTKAIKTALCIGVSFFVLSIFIQPSDKILSSGGGGALLYGIIFYYAFRSVFNAGIEWNNRHKFQYTIGLMSGLFFPLYRLFMGIIHLNSKEEKGTPFINKQFHLRTRGFGRFMVWVFGCLLVYALVSDSF